MNRLKEKRLSSRLTQKQLADETGLTSASISRYETGKHSISVDIAKRLAAALHINWIELYEEDHPVSEKEVKTNE